ncbi:MAG: lipopolysaccharide biosynthesis protein [Rhodococcus sp. (in: high G+C Gram-positive bacteria)]|nr:MAG: lipopolysaccharide biosynthesis protein [Rhodococcus sp. (in: high G+C Gram-positive bacteria)]
MRFAMQFCGIVVLGRLLSPSDYGLIAMVVALVGVGEILRDVGLGAAAVQSETSTQLQRSVLFWISVSTGVLLSVAVYLCAPLIAELYDNELVADLVRAIAVTFALNGIAAQSRAHLIRKLQFGRIAIVEVFAQSVALTFAIWFAIGGHGYWSLAWQQIIQALITMVGFVLLAKWVPSLPKRRSGVGNQLKFGSAYMATQLLVYISSNVSSVILGARFGAAQLGLYNRAFQLFSLPLNQITAPATNVALATLSRIQNDEKRFDSFVLRGQLILTNTVIFFYVLAFVEADAFVSIALGEGWTEIVPLLRAFIVGGLFQSISFSAFWIFSARGLAGSNFRFALITRILLIALVSVGAYLSVQAAASFYAIGLICIWPLGLLWLNKLHGVHVSFLFYAGIRTISVYVSWGCVAYFVTRDVQDSIISISASFFVLSVGSVVTACLWATYRQDIQQILQTVQLLRGPSAIGNTKESVSHD